MVLRESGFTPADAIVPSVAVEAPQTTFLETEVGVNQPLRINDDVIVMLGLRKRSRDIDRLKRDRVIVITGPVSQQIYFARSLEKLPDLSTKPANIARGFRSTYRSVGGNDLIVQIGRSYRLTVHRPRTPDWKHLQNSLIIEAESLRPLQFKVSDPTLSR